MMKPLWIPTEDYIKSSHLFDYKCFVNETYVSSHETYAQLHKWSVDHLDDFWYSILQYFKISYSGSLESVLNWNEKEADFTQTKWFEGISLSYAEHIFKSTTTDRPAIKYTNEKEAYREVSWLELSEMVSKIQQFLIDKGLQKGDRVAAVLNNTVETVAIFLAVNAIGAIWSCCSPDFGDVSILDRFAQIEPKVLFIDTAYQYNNKLFSKQDTLHLLMQGLPSLTTVVELFSAPWEQIFNDYKAKIVTFERVPFSHPIWILYSSGTTGKPKAITHSTGGNLLEHFKALALHQNVKSGENFLWYTTTGWMMWNYALSALLCGATLCIFDGIINHNAHQTFWNFLKLAKVDHLGAGAVYFTAINNLKIENYAPKVIGSTGSPLPAATFENLQQKFPDVHIISLSGGTDVCSAFLSGSTLLPVYAGTLQCRTLGAAIAAYNDAGVPVYQELGELVIEKPMPSMPIFFWKDTDRVKYKESYFQKFPAVWSHGDWISIHDNESVTIFGRSDATLNRAGVRIGTAEIYNAVNSLPQIVDSLVITKDYSDGTSQMLLFVKLTAGNKLSEDMMQSIKTSLRKQYSPRHVPDYVFAVDDIPYTLSGKKLELPIKKLFAGTALELVVSKDIMRNPEALDGFREIFESNWSS